MSIRTATAFAVRFFGYYLVPRSKTKQPRVVLLPLALVLTIEHHYDQRNDWHFRFNTLNRRSEKKSTTFSNIFNIERLSPTFSASHQYRRYQWVTV